MSAMMMRMTTTSARLPHLLRALALAIAIAMLFAACPAGAAASERILSYDSDVEIHADGSLSVTETIRVRAEGGQIRRGIYRDYPTRYRDRGGNRVVVGFEVTGVERDGRPEPWFTERESNGIRVNTGNDDFLAVPADITYVLRYRTTRQLGFFADHDELYWNAIGHGWVFPIERASVRVRLPRAVGGAALEVDGWTGPQGDTARDYTVAVAADGARWTLSRPLPAQAGMTVLLMFPKGLVAEPTRAQRIRWLLRDNSGALVALLGLVAMLGYAGWAWLRVGRDPPAGTVVVRYDPPEGCQPGAVRFLARMGHDNRCVTADLLALAVRGELRIDREKKFLGETWSLQRIADRGLPSEEARRLLNALVPAVGARLELDNAHASTFQAARNAHAAALEKRFVPSMFRRNSGQLGWLFAIGALAMVAAVVVSRGDGIVVIILVGIAMLVLLAVAGRLMKAPSVAGRRLMDEIAGFRRYLAVADRDDLARLQAPAATAPPIDAGRFESLLPYAVALEVEDAWTERFTAAVGAAAAARATANFGWVGGTGFDSVSSFSRAVGNGLSSRISSASTPPGSSSGGGGGGSSGGGGGGGGGGGR